MKEDFIPCGHCGGEGRIVLTGIYADTLALLRKQKKEISAVALARIAKVKPTAMNNRLTALEDFGLATSRRYGRFRLFKATPRSGDDFDEPDDGSAIHRTRETQRDPFNLLADNLEHAGFQNVIADGPKVEFYFNDQRYVVQAAPAVAAGEQGPPERIFLRHFPGSHGGRCEWFTFRTNSEQVEFLAAAPIRKALAACENWNTLDGDVTVRKSDWEALVNVINGK